MTTRLNLLHHPDDPTGFTHSYHKNFMARHFNMVQHEPGQTYNKTDTFLVVNEAKLCYPNASYWYRPFQQQGFKIVVDNLWEYKGQYKVQFPPEDLPGTHVAQCVNWFWYGESIWYKTDGTHNYIPNKQYKKLALMPINLDKPHRREMVIQFSEFLDSIIWSYASYGRTLHNDTDLLPSGQPASRHFNPEWYDDTYFSIVAESKYEDWYDMFLTEKTFKPIAYYHPMVIMGQAGALAYLQSQGFETFSNLFDESYDSEPDWVRRVSKIKQAIKDFEPVEYDQLTKQKLQHNHNLFFNTALVEQRIVDEVINPIYEYVSTQT
jgi:hypothetical protein